MEAINLMTIEDKNEVLSKNPSFKTMYFKFEKDEELPTHFHNEFSSVVVLEGEIEILFKTGECFDLKQGQFLDFSSSVEHTVLAKSFSKILLTTGIDLK